MPTFGNDRAPFGSKTSASATNTTPERRSRSVNGRAALPELQVTDSIEDPFATFSQVPRRRLSSIHREYQCRRRNRDPDMSTVQEDHVDCSEYPAVSSDENEFHNCHDDVDGFFVSAYEADDNPYDSGYEADGDPYELSDDADEAWFYRMVPEPRKETDRQYYYTREKWYKANSAHEDETESDYEANRWTRRTRHPIEFSSQVPIVDGIVEVNIEDDDNNDGVSPPSDLLLEVDKVETIEAAPVQGNRATGNLGGGGTVNEVGKALMEHLGVRP